MFLTKKVNIKTILVLLLFVCVYLLTRIPRLESDVINPDAVNWHYRSEQFVVGLKQQQFDKTYQHYHPGVILMWITGIPVELAKQLSGVEVYDQFSFYMFHYVAKFSLVFVQLVMSILLIYWLTKLIGVSKAYLTILLFSFEPFIVGNSRLYHMDLIFTLFVFSALILSYLYVKDTKFKWLVLSAFFTTLAFLTRSIGVGLYLYILFVGGLFYIAVNYKVLKNSCDKNSKSQRSCGCHPIIKAVTGFMNKYSIIFIAVTFLLFPALWVKPTFVIRDIFLEGDRVGVRGGHNQLFFGEYTENPGFLFYPIVLLLKISPFLLIGLALFLFRPREINAIVTQAKQIFYTPDKNNVLLSLISYLTIFYVGYFLVMSFPSKKLDRYMITLFPYLAILAVYGYTRLLSFKLKSSNLLTLNLLTVVTFLNFVVVPNIKYFPYLFTYTSPVFGSPQHANSIIGQKSFGVGIFELKNHIQTKYGSVVEVGFIDTKPFKAIYPNSRVSDIRIDGTSSYDILVLAINEEFPENVTKSDVKFVQDSSVFINGLEYWRIYVKQK